MVLFACLFSLEDARNKMSRVDPTSENASQLLAKHQSKVEAVQNSHKTNCDKVESDRVSTQAIFQHSSIAKLERQFWFFEV